MNNYPNFPPWTPWDDTQPGIGGPGMGGPFSGSSLGGHSGLGPYGGGRFASDYDDFPPGGYIAPPGGYLVKGLGRRMRQGRERMERVMAVRAGDGFWGGREEWERGGWRRSGFFRGYYGGR
ncbi:hypothetical protein GLAREA_03230 [Glarea lozoyensis ATCC 20868]|uniref:Uncharacterized protein n=1 Tax=Glarea lozoyensis (strain ATCC 20868 / MF5171) TaxID=1116229 RepID=S3CNN7_GLAL2|nr:uncharacterized protein GLAREA_03230 [Glarea lozoyensis ATCC 20868]EPE27315.1 hypothetical protein GLAREA_03230 [Glarea lozoyensis ATCC 20868]